MAFRNYLEGEDDKPYFHLNTLAYYYEKMEGFAALVENAAKTLNITKEEIDQRVTAYILQNKAQLDQRLGEWDEKLLQFDGSVTDLLAEWVDDGTLNHIIDTTLIDQKVTPLTLLLAETDQRIDNIISTAGDGTIPTELLDIRVLNGVTYQTAGEAVRALSKGTGLGKNSVTTQKADFIKKSSNLYDMKKVKMDTIVDTSGNEVPSTTGNATSGPHYGIPNTSYRVKHSFRVIHYDVKGVFISRPAITDGTFTTPANGHIFKLMMFNTATNTEQLNHGNVLLEYEEFYEKIPRELLDLPPLEEDEKIVNYKIQSNIPTGWYKAPDNLESYTVLDMQLADIYDEYNRFATENPQYVTKTELGLDSTNVHAINRYHFKPETVDADVVVKPLPKFVIFTNVHGDEKSATISLKNLMLDICDNWQNNEFLEYLRFNVEFIIIPICNPVGYLNHQRKNGNGVDLNRNCSFRWADYVGGTSPTSSSYKGTQPFSEKETQYIRDTIVANLDAVAIYDYHMNGSSGTDYQTMFWHSIQAGIEGETGLKEFTSMSKYNINKMTREAQKRYAFPLDSGFIGYVSYGYVNPTISAYANSLLVPSMTIECTRRMLNGPSLTYTSEVNKLNTEFIGNTILTSLREFSA